MTSKQTRTHRIRPGYWLVNVAPLGHAPDWREAPMPAPDPAPLIFGRTWRQIDAMQRKP